MVNKFKNKENGNNTVAEQVDEKPSASEKKSQQGKVARAFSDVIGGNFLTTENSVKQLPFVFFLMGVAMVYIANSYYAERTVRQINQINQELKELRSEYITTKSDLMFLSKQSEVAKALEPYGIKESVVAPKKIVVNREEKK
jgi:hypothetical protein